jgi:hypothetical protein
MNVEKLNEDYSVKGLFADSDGILNYIIASEYQKGSNLLRILNPNQTEPGNNRWILFVLPIEPGLESYWSDGLLTLKRLGLHNKYNFIAVSPSFSDWPWYADHPTNSEIRQESYFIKIIVPFIDSLFPYAGKRKGLLGMSKSGRGALSLLLRYPLLFQAAVAWDAPLINNEPDVFEMPDIFGTIENFEKYRISDLLRKSVDSFNKSKRLGIFGYDYFWHDLRWADQFMNRLGIPHDFAESPHREHRWDSGWMEQVVASLEMMVRLI